MLFNYIGAYGGLSHFPPSPNPYFSASQIFHRNKCVLILRLTIKLYIMAERIIYVSRNGQSHQLKLRDNQGHDPGNNDLTTDVDPNDTVRWELDTNSGLEAITGIKPSDSSKREYRKSQNILAAPPKSENGTWNATVVSPSPGRGKFENYMIGFKIPNDATEYWDDPKLLMKS